MVDLESDPAQGATRLVKTCMRAYGWDSNKARAVLRAYRQFLFLKATYEDYDAKILSPSRTVDMMWHQHILDVVNYVHDCALLCNGRVVGHDPRGSEQGPERDERRNATRQALLRHKDEIGIESEEWKDLLGDNKCVAGPTSSRKQEFLRLFVVTAGGSRVTIEVFRDGQSSDVYDRVVCKTGLPSRMFQLIFEGKNFHHSSASLGSIGLANDSTIYQVLTCWAANHVSRRQNVESAIQVRVVAPLGNDLTVDVWPESGRLSDVYDAVFAKMGVPARMFQLSVDHRELERDPLTTPRAFGLTDESTIWMEMKTPAWTQSPDNTDHPVPLYCKSLRGNTLTLFVWLDSGRISDLFDAVCAYEGIPTRQMRLIHAGRQLDQYDDRPLRAAGLNRESRIDLVLRLGGC